MLSTYSYDAYFLRRLTLLSLRLMFSCIYICVAYVPVASPMLLLCNFCFLLRSTVIFMFHALCFILFFFIVVLFLVPRSRTASTVSNNSSPVACKSNHLHALAEVHPTHSHYMQKSVPYTNTRKNAQKHLYELEYHDHIDTCISGLPRTTTLSPNLPHPQSPAA